MTKISTICIIALALLASCSSGKQKENKIEQNTAPEVKVTEAKKETVNIEVEFSGNIEPFVKNNISSALPQRISKIYVNIGSKVRKGELLVQMEGVSYTQASTQLRNTEADFQRIEALYKAGGISRQQYDQAQTQLSVAKDNLKNLEQNTRLTSPIDGVVTNRFFDEGDMATGQPILTLMQLQPVKIVVNLSEEFFPKTTVGTPVEVIMDVYEGKSFSGKVNAIYPTIDPTTRTFQAEVKIDNPKMEIRPGMFARVKVNFGKAEKILIPDMAVIKQVGTNDKFVYILDGNTVRYERITLGKLIDSNFIVTDGVKEGDKIVIAGQNKLADKMEVKIVE